MWRHLLKSTACGQKYALIYDRDKKRDSACKNTAKVFFVNCCGLHELNL